MPGLYRDGIEKAQLESRNGVIQFLAVVHWIEEWRRGDPLITPDTLKELQRLAINQIYTCAGDFRDGPVSIVGVPHQPPKHSDVPHLVDEMCAYVNGAERETPIHRAAYVMWRLNWIHPFFGGNGRTARAASYLVLCRALGFRLPGEKTIPDQIVAHRGPYYDALQKADAAWTGGRLDLGAMEELMDSMLAAQLVSIHSAATGRTPPAD